MLAGLFLVRSINTRSQHQAVDSAYQLHEAAKMREKEVIAADTAAGASPQEVVQLFVGAVRNGDNQKASRYMVVERQSDVERMLSVITAENREALIRDLIAASLSPNDALESNEFIVHEPRLVRALQYPDGRWKLVSF